MATARADAVANPKPGTRGYLKWWWTKGPGLKRWAGSPKPWTTLRRQLGKHIKDKSPAVIDSITSAWYREVFGRLPGRKKK
ncbi:hypothetical protein GCM10009613_61070 [Pseudonocardia kongjuensis]|uniref:Uncharacterized protein n=1 Tax=Pseudonocardia kongjuensis TaxID=102227 RepID=A0ABN1Y9U6_9PSEU